MVQLTDDDYTLICNRVLEMVDEEDFEDDIVTVYDMHSISVRY